MKSARSSLLAGCLVLSATCLAGCGSTGSKSPASSSTAPQTTGTEGLQGTTQGNLGLAGLLNANNGALDRVVNGFLQGIEWAKSALPNFDRVSDNLLRGGQPRPEDGWAKLKEMGVRTVVNLRMEDNSEAAAVQAAGMTPAYIPVPDTGAPTADQVRRFREILAGADSGRIYVHCSAGKFRTSTMIAIYLIDNGASADQALADARRHGWKPDWLDSPKEESFIRDYAANPGNWR